MLFKFQHLLLIVHNCKFTKAILSTVFNNYFVNNKSTHVQDTRRINDLHMFNADFTLKLCSSVHGLIFWNELPDAFNVLVNYSVL